MSAYTSHYEVQTCIYQMLPQAGQAWSELREHTSYPTYTTMFFSIGWIMSLLICLHCLLSSGMQVILEVKQAGLAVKGALAKEELEGVQLGQERVQGHLLCRTGGVTMDNGEVEKEHSARMWLSVIGFRLVRTVHTLSHRHHTG